MKKATAIILAFTIMIATTSCAESARGEDGRDMTGQKEVSRIARYDSEIPDHYRQFDYEAAALAYDELLFGEQQEGAYFPLMWKDVTHDTFGIAAYVGDGRSGSDGGQEAVATVASDSAPRCWVWIRAIRTGSTMWRSCTRTFLRRRGSC